jgi:hypothetical protein
MADFELTQGMALHYVRKEMICFPATLKSDGLEAEAPRRTAEGDVLDQYAVVLYYAPDDTEKAKHSIETCQRYSPVLAPDTWHIADRCPGAKTTAEPELPRIEAPKRRRVTETEKEAERQ